MFIECPGRINLLMHRIDTEDARPKRFNPRPLNVHKKALLDVALQEMIDTRAVRKSRSPWAFPIVLAPKKDGTARLCVDFRELNAITVRDSYPFLSVDFIMYHLGTASVFTTLDCSRCFLQIPIREEDIPKTAFTCCRCIYEFVRMPFGLTNSPATFQRLMDLVLGDAKDVVFMAYMDDVVMFSHTFEEQFEHLRMSLERMRDARLTVNPGKVKLASSRVKLLGYVVDHGTVRPSEDKLKAILEYPPPHKEKSLRRFLGILAFHTQFIPNYAQLSHPLNQLLRKGV